MIRCQLCNNQNLSNAEFCDDCGMPLTKTSEPLPTPPPPSFLRTDVKPNQALPLTPLEKLFSEGSEKKLPPARITLLAKGKAGHEFVVTKTETLIGRWDATRGVFPDIDLEQLDVDTKVSRRHARIVWHDEQYWIEDLGSLNGTVVNRELHLQKGKPIQLKNGDEIIVGKLFLQFHVE